MIVLLVLSKMATILFPSSQSLQCQQKPMDQSTIQPDFYEYSFSLVSVSHHGGNPLHLSYDSLRTSALHRLYTSPNVEHRFDDSPSTLFMFQSFSHHRHIYDSAIGYPPSNLTFSYHNSVLSQISLVCSQQSHFYRFPPFPCLLPHLLLCSSFSQAPVFTPVFAKNTISFHSDKFPSLFPCSNLFLTPISVQCFALFFGSDPNSYNSSRTF